MTTGEDYERQLANKKELRRFIGELPGSNKKLQDKINNSRAADQYASQQTLQRLAEQNSMSFDLISEANNKLNASGFLRFFHLPDERFARQSAHAD